MVIGNRKNVVLNETANKIYTLHASTEEEVNEITEILQKKRPIDIEKYPFINEIDCVGDIDSTYNQHISSYIPITGIKQHLTEAPDSRAKPKVSKEFKCYVYKCVGKYSNLILHEDALSGFKCACSSILTKYFFVTVVDKEKLQKELNKLENARESIPNSNRDTEVYTTSEDVGTSESNLLLLEWENDKSEGENLPS